MDKPVKILFLATNPKDIGQLRRDEEIREIKQALLQAEFRDKFDIEQEWAVRVTDLQGHLLRHKPDIVHFSGRGSEANELILEDLQGYSQTVPTGALSQLFNVLKQNVRCVVLNASYTKKQAQAIAKHIDCVIGMSKAIGDEAAINFAIAFYQALGYGKDVKTAFDLGCVQIDLQRINEKDTPKLLAFNSDPNKIVFVNKPSTFQYSPKTTLAKNESPQLKSVGFIKILEKQRLSKAPISREKELRFRKWQLTIVGITIPIVVAVIQLLPELKSGLKSEKPRFGLVSPITRPSSGITIEARNQIANRSILLDVEFDGLSFINTGQPIPFSNPQRWHFKLYDRNLPDSLLSDGSHRMRVGFAGELSAEVWTVIFHTHAPIVQAEIVRPLDKPRDRIVKGYVASKLQAPDETLAVEIAFHSEGNLMKTYLPVEREFNNTTGITSFKFETTIQGLPQIPLTSRRYAEDFFAFRVKDQAGNEYYHKESYAQFTAPGDKRFGVNKLADIEAKLLPPDSKGNTKMAFRLVPKPKPITYLPNGEPAIILKVTSMARNVNQLEWADLPENLRPNQPVTVILRDERQLAFSFLNQYTDNKAPSTSIYRVEQSGRDGQIYVSNTVKALSVDTTKGLTRRTPAEERLRELREATEKL